MTLVLEEEELHERTINKIVCSCNKRKHIVYSDTNMSYYDKTKHKMYLCVYIVYISVSVCGIAID